MFKRFRFQFGSKVPPKDNSSLLGIRRTSSEQVVTRECPDLLSHLHEEAMAPCTRSRASTFTNGISRPSRPSFPSKKISNSETPIEDKIMEQLFPSPRHFQRRKAVVDDDIGLSLNKQASMQPDSNSVLVCLEDGGTRIEDTALVNNTHSLRDIVEMLLIKKDVTLSHEDLNSYTVSAWFQDSPVENVTLDQPSADLAGHIVEVRLKEGVVSESKQEGSLSRGKLTRMSSQPSQEFNTVADCLSYFSDHGLVELPLPHSDDPDTYHLPRVQPIDQIVGSWSDLPIDPEKIKALSKKEKEQQLAIWELVYTEHSHLRQLETVINVFMRCLELIRRTKLLSEENYHNVFGYMEDIYNIHDQLWTWTLEPALEKVYETGLPLDLNEIISRFPEFGAHFEIYEQHCQLEALNLHSFKKAKENSDFTAYLEWCESQPECHRLGLDQFLATPMQRLTRYPLLISAIIKKTTQPHLKQRLEHLCEEMQEFVQCVNSGIRIQEETERVRDAMARITGFQVVDVPSDMKELVQPYTHLDLLAPMAGVEVDRARVLMLEGALKYRDSSMSSAKMVPLHLFLFTDMLLVTKLSSRKGGDKYTIIREPYKIDRLVLHPLEPGSFCGVVLNEFHVVSSWFILKATCPKVALKWMDQISTAQHYYIEAVERRTQHWKLLQNLQNERILNGIEGKESLSTSLWAISPGSRNLNVVGSSESLALKRTSSPTINPIKKRPLTRTRSEDQAKKLIRCVHSDVFRPVPQSDIPATPKLSAIHTKSPSLDRLLEHPEVPAKLKHSTSQSRLAVSQLYLSSFKQSSEESLSMSIQQIPASPLSEDSGTESGGTISAEGLSERSRTSPALYRAGSDGTQEGSPSSPLIADTNSQSGYLKPILRLKHSKEETLLCTPRGLHNRAHSDDSGIAFKSRSSPDPKELSSSLDSRDGQQSPSFLISPCGRTSLPSYGVQPCFKSKVTFKSQSNSTIVGAVPGVSHDAISSPILSVDEVIPEGRGDSTIKLSSPTSNTDSTITSPVDLSGSEDICSSCLATPSIAEETHSPPTARKEVIHSPSTDRNEAIHSPIQEPKGGSSIRVSVPSPILTLKKIIPSPVERSPSPNQCKPTAPNSKPSSSSSSAPKPPTKPGKKPTKDPPPVTKKPLRRSAAVGSVAAPSPSNKAKEGSDPKKSTGEQVRVPSGGRRRSVVATQPPPSPKKPSQLRRPSITIPEGGVSVKDVRQKFETPEKSKLPKPVSSAPHTRKFSQPNPSVKPPVKPLPATHNRSKSAVSSSDGVFTRQKAVRGKTSSPKQRPQSKVPPKKPSVPQAKPGSSITRSVSTKTSREIPTKGLKTSSFDESREPETSQHLIPPERTPTPNKRLSDLHNMSDTRIGIELDGELERGIDIPLNMNNNNNQVERKNSETRIRKPSHYLILEAVTVKTDNAKNLTYPRKLRNPIDWCHFGGTWKHPHAHTHTSLASGVALRNKHLVQQHT